MDTMMMVYLGVLIVFALVCGAGSAVAGGGFLWGFLFGPVGIIVSAVIGQGEKTRHQLMNMSSTIRTSATGNGTKPRVPTSKPSFNIKCPECGDIMTDITQPGTYQCQGCGKYVTVK